MKALGDITSINTEAAFVILSFLDVGEYSKAKKAKEF